VYPLPEDEEEKNRRKMKQGRTQLEQEVARCYEREITDERFFHLNNTVSGIEIGLVCNRAIASCTPHLLPATMRFS